MGGQEELRVWKLKTVFNFLMLLSKWLTVGTNSPMLTRLYSPIFFEGLNACLFRSFSVPNNSGPSNDLRSSMRRYGDYHMRRGRNRFVVRQYAAFRERNWAYYAGKALIVIVRSITAERFQLKYMNSVRVWKEWNASLRER